MKIKTADLAGAALNWAVATIEGQEIEIVAPKRIISVEKPPHSLPYPKGRSLPFNYTESWGQTGPIIDREKITVGPNTRPVMSEGTYAYRAHPFQPDGEQANGPTPLIAAMRCYVAMRLGDEIDVPDELLPQGEN